MALQLRQVEIGAGASRLQGRVVVVEIEAEIDERACHLGAVDQDMRLHQVPAARAHQQHCGVRSQFVRFAVGGIDKVDLAGPSVHHVDLCTHHVGPGGGRRILTVGHEHLGAGVQRVDDHLPVRRAGDFDTPVLQISRNSADAPVTLAHSPGFREKVRQRPSVPVLLPFQAGGQQLPPPRIELPVQPGSEGQRAVRQDPLKTRCHRARDRNAVRECHDRKPHEFKYGVCRPLVVKGWQRSICDLFRSVWRAAE